MNFPKMGLMADDPGKCVLGTVPVEADGSAWFRAPSGVTLFFQALDAQGLAVQTMRSATYAQPGETVGCIGCHEPRHQTASASPVLASLHEPSRITPGPEGSWPLRFDRLIQPVLDQQCVSCHAPGAKGAQPAKLDLTATKAYDSAVVRDGKTYSARNTFLIDPAGVIRKVYLKVNPLSHSDDLLADLAQLQAAK